MNWVEAQAHKPIPAPFFLPANLFNKKTIGHRRQFRLLKVQRRIA